MKNFKKKRKRKKKKKKGNSELPHELVVPSGNVPKQKGEKFYNNIGKISNTFSEVSKDIRDISSKLNLLRENMKQSELRKNAINITEAEKKVKKFTKELVGQEGNNINNRNKNNFTKNNNKKEKVVFKEKFKYKKGKKQEKKQPFKKNKPQQRPVVTTNGKQGSQEQTYYMNKQGKEQGQGQEQELLPGAEDNFSQGRQDSFSEQVQSGTISDQGLLETNPEQRQSETNSEQGQPETNPKQGQQETNPQQVPSSTISGQDSMSGKGINNDNESPKKGFFSKLFSIIGGGKNDDDSYSSGMVDNDFFSDDDDDLFSLSSFGDKLNDNQTFLFDGNDSDEESLIDKAVNFKNKKYLKSLNVSDLRSIMKNNNLQVSKKGSYLKKNEMINIIKKNVV